MSDLIHLSAAELSTKLAAGDITSVEVTQAHLDRIAAVLSREGVASERNAGDSRPGEGDTLSFALPSGHRMRLATGTKNRRAGISDFASDGTPAPCDMDHINLLGEASPEVESTNEPG